MFVILCKISSDIVSLVISNEYPNGHELVNRHAHVHYSDHLLVRGFLSGHLIIGRRPSLSIYPASSSVFPACAICQLQADGCNAD